MSISTLIINPEDVLYKRIPDQPHLRAFLNTLGIEPRHPKVVEKAMKAARFDALMGRISRDVYYNAILKVHSVPEHANMRAGREALLADALLARPNIKAIEVLNQLHAAGIRLALVINTEHSSSEIIQWLNHLGFIHTLWHQIVVSNEIGYMIPEPTIFEAIIEHTEGNVYLSRQAIPWLIERGIINLVYGDDTSVRDAYNVYNIEQLIDLLVA
ncbi:MAG: hypothetical protein CUN55_05590 [Phototrophicales bacterium]|nr:MAG: hypothetical protein CUN55_05590 [Phototrophicales bacterium]